MMTEAKAELVELIEREYEHWKMLWRSTDNLAWSDFLAERLLSAGIVGSDRWQPIASAPRDGTEIELMELVSPAFWTEDPRLYGAWEGPDSLYGDTFTHWRPLPAPPLPLLPFEIGCLVQPRGGGLVIGELLEFNEPGTGALIRWNDGNEIWKALRNLEVIGQAAPLDGEDRG